MIFYFSATGNSKYTAEILASRLSDAAFPIKDYLKSGNAFDFSIGDNTKLGFVLPVYSYGIPTAVSAFIASLPEICAKLDRSVYVYAVFTCGSVSGYAYEILGEELLSHGIRLDAAFTLATVDSYTYGIPLPDGSDIDAILDRQHVRSLEFAEFIARRQCGFDHAVLGNVDRVGTRKSYREYLSSRSCGDFSVADSCVGCGICEEACPDSAIEITDGKAKFIKAQCTFCFACLHRCPSAAISLRDHGEFSGQYVNKRTDL